MSTAYHGPVELPVLVAWLSSSDAEGNRQLWGMYPTWGHLCQSTNVTHLHYHTFGVVACWLYQIWDNDGDGSIPKHSKPFGLLWPFHKTPYGIHDCQSDGKSSCYDFVAYMTPNQMAKTVATFLWQGYALIFGTLAKFLSNWGANFESNIIRELCKLMSIQKVMTSPYHAHTSGQVEQAHQTLMHMIGKLSKDQKADWTKHLPKLVHAYNSMRLAFTRYNPHYLMFGHQPCLPIDFYFPMAWGTQKYQHVSHYVAELHERLWGAFKDAQVQSTSEVERQKWHYNRKANAISLEPGDLVLAKANAYRGRRKVKDWWEEDPYEVECTNCRGCPFLPYEKPADQDAHESSTKIDFFSLLGQRGLISVWLCRPSRPGAPPPP